MTQPVRLATAIVQPIVIPADHRQCFSLAIAAAQNLVASSGCKSWFDTKFDLKKKKELEGQISWYRELYRRGLASIKCIRKVAFAGLLYWKTLADAWHCIPLHIAAQQWLTMEVQLLRAFYSCYWPSLENFGSQNYLAFFILDDISLYVSIMQHQQLFAS